MERQDDLLYCCPIVGVEVILGIDVFNYCEHVRPVQKCCEER